MVGCTRCHALVGCTRCHASVACCRTSLVGCTDRVVVLDAQNVSRVRRRGPKRPLARRFILMARMVRDGALHPKKISPKMPCCIVIVMQKEDGAKIHPKRPCCIGCPRVGARWFPSAPYAARHILPLLNPGSVTTRFALCSTAFVGSFFGMGSRKQS